MKVAALGVLLFMASWSDAADLAGKLLRSVKQGGISGAQVTLTRETTGKTEIIASTASAKDGTYTFRNLQPGQYTVTALGNLEPPWFKAAPLNRGRSEIKTFEISKTFELSTGGLSNLNIGIGCED